MVIKEVQADNELLSARQYQEGKFTVIVVVVFVSSERFTCLRFYFHETCEKTNFKITIIWFSNL